MPTRDEKVITTVCQDHCISACVLKLYVKDGVITRIETDNGQEPQFRACQKGRAYRQYVYHPDRLKYPLKRVGERGEGKFERISWDEALDTIASQLKRVNETYGPLATIMLTSSGDMGRLHNQGLIDRVLTGVGGYTGILGTVSDEGSWFASMASLGSYEAGFSGRPSFSKARQVIMWGFNPVVTRRFMSMRHLGHLKDNGAKMVAIDPKYTETAALLEAEWIPIRPGTDTAMLVAMAYVIIEEKLYDQEFLDKYTVGFDEFESYVTGKADGVPKTPAWAEGITGVSAATIASLAREYATSKPAVLVDGWAPARTAFGEQFNRAAFTLAAMTGNYAVLDGSPGFGVTAAATTSLRYVSARMGGDDNPAHLNAPLRPGSVFFQRAPRSDSVLRHALFYGGGPSIAYLNRVRVADAILKGREGGYPADYKLLYMVTINWLNQYANTNKIAQALRKLEFVVAQEQFMTATAKFADIVLPTNTHVERNDLTAAPALYGYMNKAIESLGESKSQFQIAKGLAERLGVTCFGDKSEEDWLREVAADRDDIKDYDTLKKEGIQKNKLGKEFIPFGTPSGKIEIYSKDLAEMGDPNLPPIPTYIETWESISDPLAEKYPLQLITSHFFRRVHSKFEDVPWLRELEAQTLLINPIDARARGIGEGDLVRVFNDRGETIIPAQITERIMPGVVDLPEGGKYDPDENGIDRGGCPNVLTSDKPSPGGALCSNTALVQVEKADRRR